MKNKKLFIFDLDGTLVDTAPDFKNSLNYMLSELNYPLITLEEIRNLVKDPKLKEELLPQLLII